MDRPTPPVNSLTNDACPHFLTWPGINRYEGAFSRGKRDGQGKYFYANGDSYEGQFKVRYYCYPPWGPGGVGGEREREGGR